MKNRQSIMAVLLAACAALSACATVPGTSVGAPAADRAAIKAMAGEYRVTFSFRETVALAPRYTLTPPKDSGATEWVSVIEDTPERISLQHILVMGKPAHVVKHWRQDWVWQPKQTWGFDGNRHWTRQALNDGAASGQWEQSVWEVDDSPRYFGIGRWIHKDGNSSWTSQPTPRPLPRREYTVRNDYDVLLAVNRHVITPQGWVHEQDNTKLVIRNGSRSALAREVGVNTYTRIGTDEYDFSAGREYWQRTAAFWEKVRAEWAQHMATTPTLQLREHADGDAKAPLAYELLFGLAEKADQVGAAEIRTAIDRIVVIQGSQRAR